MLFLLNLEYEWLLKGGFGLYYYRVGWYYDGLYPILSMLRVLPGVFG